jgi:DNA-binding MarR family transcriptional regulator
VWPVRPGSRSPRRPELATRRTPKPSSSARPTRAARAELPGEAEFEQEYPGSSYLATLALRDLELAGTRLERAVAALCRPHGVSHAALNALAVIEGHAAPIAPGELAERMHVTSGTMTSLIDNLERQGLVTRRPDPDDRRRLLLDVTKEAQAMLDVILPEIQQLAKAIFAPLSDRQIQALLSTLETVERSLESVPSELPPAVRNRPPRLER